MTPPATTEVPDSVLEYLTRLAYASRVRLELATRLSEQGILNARDVQAAQRRSLHDEGLLKEYIHQQRRRTDGQVRSSMKKVGIDTK